MSVDDDFELPSGPLECSLCGFLVSNGVERFEHRCPVAAAHNGFLVVVGVMIVVAVILLMIHPIRIAAQ